MLTPYDRKSLPYFRSRSYVVSLPSMISGSEFRGDKLPVRGGCVDGKQVMPAVSSLENARTRKLQSTKGYKNEDDDLSRSVSEKMLV